MSHELKSERDTLKKTSSECSKSHNRTSRLRKEVQKLRTKVLHAPGQRDRAVKAAVSKVVREFGERQNIWRIKRPDGRIEDWIRDLSCRLIAIHHLPASRTPSAISDIIQTFKAHTGDHNGTDDSGTDPGVDPGSVETFSDRSVRRFPLEGHVLVKMQIAKEFKAAPG